MKTLTIFFSRSGKTKIVAEEIAKKFKGTTRQLKEKANRKGFFNYIKAGYDAIKQKPAVLINPDNNLNYDIIFVGTPTWAGRPCPAIITYLNTQDFKNKKVVLFATFASSPSLTIKNMRDILEKKGCQIIDTFSIRTTGSEKKIRELTKAELEKLAL